jgi:hypothetical protein
MSDRRNRNGGKCRGITWQRQRDFADFVEKYCATIGKLKHAGAGRVSSGKCAAGMAKEFTF